MHHYNISNDIDIDECKCQQRCENDMRCYGYSIDAIMETCSFSRCKYSNQLITSSTDSDFYSKKIPKSFLSFVPDTTRSAVITIKYTTPTTKQTTLEQTIPVTSHIPIDEATNVTKLTRLASSLNSGSINDATQ